MSDNNLHVYFPKFEIFIEKKKQFDRILTDLIFLPPRLSCFKYESKRTYIKINLKALL